MSQLMSHHLPGSDVVNYTSAPSPGLFRRISLLGGVSPAMAPALALAAPENVHRHAPNHHGSQAVFTRPW